MARSDIIMAYSAEKYCDQCGGYIYIPDVRVWRYRIRWRGGTSKWFCIWSCMEHWKREHEKPPKEIKEKWYPKSVRFANDLRLIRENLGISLKETAEYIGYSSTSQLIRLEKGYVPIPKIKLGKICELFKCTPEDINERRVDEKNSGLSEE